MTGDTTDMSSASYGKGTYVADASGEFYGNGTDCAHHAFDRVVHGGGEEEGSDVTHWHSNGLDDSEGWIRLDMPVRIRVTRYALHSRNNDLVTGTDFPDTFVLEGSNDGSTWSSLDSRTDQAGSISEPYTRKEYSVSTSSYYSKIRLWVTSVGPNGTGRENAIGGHAGDRKYVVLTQFELYGTMEEEDRTTLYWIVGGGVVGFLFLLAIVLLL